MDEKNRILNSGLLEQYVLGLLNPKEVYLVEKHLETHPDLLAHVRALEDAMQSVLEDNAIAPPPKLKSDILSEIDELEQIQKKQSDSSSASSSSWLTALVAVFALSLAFGTYHFYQKSQLSHESLQSLNNKYIALKEDCADKQNLLQAQYQFVKDPATKHIHLKGTGLAPAALVVAYLNEVDENVAIDIVNLPTAPKGKRYHLWADVEGEMIHMGDLDAVANSLQDMKFIAAAESLNITLEDEGDVEEPTVSQLYVNAVV